MEIFLTIGLLLLFWGMKTVIDSNLIAWVVCIITALIVWPKKRSISSKNPSPVRTGLNVILSIAANLIGVILFIGGLGSAWLTFGTYNTGEIDSYYSTIAIGIIVAILAAIFLFFINKRPKK